MLPLLTHHASLQMKVAQLTLEHILQQHVAVISQATTLAAGSPYGSLAQQQQQQQPSSGLTTVRHAQQQQQQPQQQQLVSQPGAAAFLQRAQSPAPLLHQLWPAQHLLHRSLRHHHQQKMLCTQQQLRTYHPATHAARGLTSRLLQQRSWQELRMLFDASGGGDKLNPIQLCALFQHLARLAPAPELLTATERSELHKFAQELTAACMLKMHRMDAVGLANMISSALKLGCTLPLQQQQQQQEEGQPAQQQQQQQFAYADILSAATKQVAYADGHAAGMLLAALTNLHHQQQQQHDLQALQQQLNLWHKFTLALSQRLQACVTVQQLSSGNASKLCSTVSRLSGLFVRQRTAAAAAVNAAGAAASGTPPPAPQQQQDELESDSGSGLDSQLGYASEGDTAARSLGAVQPAVGTTTASGKLANLQDLQLQYRQLQQQLRALLSLAAQQVQQQASAQGSFVSDSTGAAAAVPGLADFSRVLNALARIWAWPGWPAVQGLLLQYSSRVEAVQIMAAAMAAAEEQQSGGSRRGHQQRRQTKQSSPLLGVQGGLGFTGGLDGSALGSGCAYDGRDIGSSAELIAAVRDSLAPTLWAVGRLSEQRQQQGVTQRPQQQQQQQQREVLLQDLQQHQQLWKSLSPVLGACQQQLSWLGPMQLAQVAAGLGKLVGGSRSLLEAAVMATAGAAAGGGGTAAWEGSQTGTTGTPDLGAACVALEEMLNGPQLRRLLQQHVSRVESLLPLLVRQHRLQIAAAYRQLGLQVPQSVASVFERDGAQQQQQQQ